MESSQAELDPVCVCVSAFSPCTHPVTGTEPAGFALSHLPVRFPFPDGCANTAMMEKPGENQIIREVREEKSSNGNTVRVHPTEKMPAGLREEKHVSLETAGAAKMSQERQKTLPK